MTDDQLPALYQDSDRTAMETQRNFLLATKAILISSLLIGLAPNVFQRELVISIQVISSAIVISASAYLAFGRPQKTWYATRALAESVKTISWRYACRSEPFDCTDEESSKKFAHSVKELLLSNNEATALRYKSASTDLITKRMNEIRNSNLQERRDTYLYGRIENQHEWYRRKSTFNDRRSKIWYASLLISSGVALSVSLMNLMRPTDLISVDFLFAIPVAIFGWVQVKRYQELASSYALTAHEIDFVKSSFAGATTEESFKHFVADAENAFSREHTQWYARKDVG